MKMFTSWKRLVWDERKSTSRMNDAWSSGWIWYCEFWIFRKLVPQIDLCVFFSIYRSIAYLCHSNDVNHSQRNWVYELQKKIEKQIQPTVFWPLSINQLIKIDELHKNGRWSVWLNEMIPNSNRMAQISTELFRHFRMR